MGIRSNVGNVTTNAVQIASVGATTLGGVIKGIRRDMQYAKDRADLALVNKTREEERLAKMQENERLKQKDPNTYKKEWFTPEKAKEVGEKEAEKRYNRAMGVEETEDIDELINLPQTEQSSYIQESVSNNIKYLKELLKGTNEPLEEIMNSPEIKEILGGE